MSSSLLALVAACCMAGTAAIADEAPVGAFLATKPNGAYEIARGGMPLDAHYYMPLDVGDVVTIKRPGASVKLDIAGADAIVVCTVDRARPPCNRPSPYTVEPPRETHGQWALNIIEKVGSWLSRARERRRDLVGRGGPKDFALTMPGLADGIARISAGQRIFGVAWQGGVAPFLVTIRDSNGVAIVHYDRLAHHELIVRSEPPRFAEGLYEVTIEDATHAALHGKFIVLEATQIPRPRADFLPADVDDEIETVFNAAWLQQNSGPSYSYEAYLEVLPLTLTDRPPEDALALSFDITHPKPSNSRPSQ